MTTTPTSRHGRTGRCTRALAGGAATLALAGTPTALAQDGGTILQWFEAEWDDIERRAPDFFLAGYDAVWLPPPSKASFKSPGYDPFDRFDLGKPPLLTNAPDRARTTYGTEATFRAMVDELQQANAQVYVDTIMNHNSGRTTSDAFLAQGGWPGFWIPRENPPRDKQPTDDWGDFHAGNAGGFLQSENPGAPNYDLFRGDLVALIDISQESTNFFIRHPVGDDPANIPGGSIWNRPDPSNARLYPDLALSPRIINNPGTSRNPGQSTFTRYPFNTAAPERGDPVEENTTGLLMRWARWLVEVQGVDGFRLDAQKHVPSWFWDTFFDAAVHRTRRLPTGGFATPFSFGESLTGNFDMLDQWVRKDAFANRDCLDINGAARLRDLVGAGGFGTWADLQSNPGAGHLDEADDGLINGSAGVNHVFSHDNGSTGDGTAMPGLPSIRQQGLPQHAYMLLRPGRTIVYHNARGVARNFGFFPREGTPLALGWDPAAGALDDALTTLVRLRNQIGYGLYFPKTFGSDVVVYERAFGGVANCLVGANDRYDAGVTSVTVQTQYPQGTRLHEQTGNASDPAVDPDGQVPETIVVGPAGAVTLVVPRNASSAGEHGRGYVVYSEALPTAAVTIVGQSGVIEPDPAGFPDWLQRLNAIPVVGGDFEIQVTTTQTDPLDPNTDDNALFRINQGAEDYNGNGVIDIPPATLVLGGYEEFLTFKRPLFGSGLDAGSYRQSISADQLGEGFHYVDVVAFRHRPAGTSPIFRRERAVVYVDQEPPAIELAGADEPFADPRPTFSVRALDRTTTSVHLFVDLPAGSDPLDLVDQTNQALPWDRFEFRKTSDATLAHGHHAVTIVAFEHSGRAGVVTETVFVDLCPADVNDDGALNFFDVSAFLTLFNTGDPSADFNDDGALDFFDVSAFLAAFNAGC